MSDVGKNHQISTKYVLKKAYKSTQNALSMGNKQNSPDLRIISAKCSHVRIKDDYENIFVLQMRAC